MLKINFNMRVFNFLNKRESDKLSLLDEEEFVCSHNKMEEVSKFSFVKYA